MNRHRRASAGKSTKNANVTKYLFFLYTTSDHTPRMIRWNAARGPAHSIVYLSSGALLMAVQYRQPAKVDILLRLGADPNEIVYHTHTPILLTGLTNNKITTSLIQAGADTDCIYASRTHFQKVLLECSEATLLEIIDKTTMSTFPDFLLNTACTYDRRSMIRFLLDRGLPVTYTAIRNAREYSSPEVVQSLRDKIKE